VGESPLLHQQSTRRSNWRPGTGTRQQGDGDQRRRDLPDEGLLRSRSNRLRKCLATGGWARGGADQLLIAAWTAAVRLWCASPFVWRSVLISIRTVPATSASGRSASDSRRR